jgi:two-component system, cell cycle sensor histidine kinase and response regulator CckA
MQSFMPERIIVSPDLEAAAGAIRRFETGNLPDAAPSIADKAIIGAALCNVAPWGGPESILLVEDEAFVRKVTAEILESAGYTLVVSRNAAEALKACGECSKPVDLLLADIVMPGMSGQELASDFQSLYPRARVLLMSGCAEQLTWCEFSPYGKTYLAKPFAMRTLLQRVREVLDTVPLGWGAPA